MRKKGARGRSTSWIRPSRRWIALIAAGAFVSALVLGLPGPGREAGQAQAQTEGQSQPGVLPGKGPAPSPAAVAGQQAAENPSTPGPVQPIPFSHKVHAGKYQIACLYCHTGTDRSRAAGVPSVQVCMGCHRFVGDRLAGVQKLREYWKEKKTIPWIQIHWLPEFVQFQHRRHVAAGFSCQTCHGPVQDLDKLYLVPDTKWWPWLIPAQKLQMGWCIQCHRANQASTDCLTCHY